MAGSCSERYFYGERDETAVDERITEYESKQLSPLWESLCMSPAGPVHLAGIPEMLVHFETRTKNFRDLIAEPIEQMRLALQRELEDIRSLTTRMVARARKRPRSLFPSPTGRDLKIRTAIRRMSDQQLQLMFLPILSETGGQFQHALSALVVQKLTKEAHNRSLAKLGVMPERAKLYAALRFVLLDVPDGELVLGDSVIAVLPSGSDRWYPFLDNGVDPRPYSYRCPPGEFCLAELCQKHCGVKI